MRLIPYAAPLLLATLACSSLIPTPAPAPPRRSIRVDIPFDTVQAARMLAPGPNKIRGSALLRQRGGGVVTCAGTTVLLIPATAYARERLGYFYGSGETGYIVRNDFVIDSPQVDPGAWNRLQRETLCDAQGYFTFDRFFAFHFANSIAWAVVMDSWIFNGHVTDGYDESGWTLLRRLSQFLGLYDNRPWQPFAYIESHLGRPPRTDVVRSHC